MFDVETYIKFCFKASKKNFRNMNYPMNPYANLFRYEDSAYILTCLCVRKSLLHFIILFHVLCFSTYACIAILYMLFRVRLRKDLRSYCRSVFFFLYFMLHSIDEYYDYLYKHCTETKDFLNLTSPHIS